MAPPPVYDYCTKDDVFRLGVARAALKSVPPADIEAAISTSSRLIDSYLKPAEYTLPLSAFGGDIREAAAVITAWRVLKVKGYNPSDSAHEIIRLDYEDKIKWLQGVAAGTVIPDVTDSGGVVEEPSPSGKPAVITNLGRGWEENGGGAFTGGRR